MVLTLADWMIIAAGLAAAFNAVQNGLGKEMLHTFLLCIGIVAGALFLKDANTPTDAPAIASQFINFGFYLFMLYVLLWVAIRTFGVLVIGDYYGGWRVKFWGGILALTKLIMLGLGFMLAYAVASPLPSPERLMLLPKVLSSSALVNFADVEADYMYHALAKAGWVSNDKLPVSAETVLPENTVSETVPVPAAEPSPTLVPMNGDK